MVRTTASALYQASESLHELVWLLRLTSDQEPRTYHISAIPLQRHQEKRRRDEEMRRRSTNNYNRTIRAVSFLFATFHLSWLLLRSCFFFFCRINCSIQHWPIAFDFPLIFDVILVRIYRPDQHHKRGNYFSTALSGCVVVSWTQPTARPVAHRRICTFSVKSWESTLPVLWRHV